MALTNNPEARRWHHGPQHFFVPNCFYIVTGGTLNKEHLFNDPEKRYMLQDTIFAATMAYGWKLQAWAIFSNHYHCIALSPEDPKTLIRVINRVHSGSARELNRMDNSAGRKVWHQYWDTCLTFEASYYARLSYVINNPVKHELATDPTNYPWCSAAWFVENAERTFKEKILTYRWENVRVEDDF